MDDDIDIEEHDVMDNPKIRNIFPDLSLVKIEAPDENEEDDYEVPLQFESDTENLNYNIKEEIQSDNENYSISLTHSKDNEPNSISHYRQNTNNDFAQSGQRNACRYDQNVNTIGNYDQTAQNTRDFEQEKQYDGDNIHPFNNKIILGSKPDPHLEYDRLYEEALQSTATVLLEDWNLKLKNSPCYCLNCEILFPTVNAIDAHRSIKHSLLVALDTPRQNTARKSTVTSISSTKSTYCNHCDKTFPDDNALIKHLYELLPLNSYHTPKAIKVENPNIQYSCAKCKKSFDTLTEGKEHKKICHPNLKKTNLILCKTPETIHSEHQIVVKHKDVNDKVDTQKLSVANAELVPKSVLFQCNVCLVGFLSCFSASQHARSCENKTKKYKLCNVCKRKIRTVDFPIHLLQHKYNDRLRIYTLNNKICEKVILKCPSCHICFEERDFWSHWKICNKNKVVHHHCFDCNLDIEQIKFPSHRLKHTVKKMTKKDFIVIEFYDLNDTSLKNINSKSKVYYCDICGSYKTEFTTRGHEKGNCKQFILAYCDLCGLGFSKKYYKLHRLTHNNSDSSIKDLEIISLKSGQQIEPSMPAFHQCPKCQIHFLFKQNIYKHNCRNEPFETCVICSKKYNSKAIVPHTKFHDFKRDTDMPKLLKMYNSIKSVWNIVYECVNCNLVTVTYDSAVEHSQDHICGKRKLFKTCDICNFDIINQDYITHMNLHENNSNINRTHFTMLRFDYNDMYKKKWMNIFLPLPKQHKYQILGKSIYRCTRRFRLDCEINRRTDDVKFYCKNCKTSVSIEDMKRHYFDQQCPYSPDYICRFCNMAFSNLRECVAHESEHENPSKIYKVYTFNDKKNKEWDKKLLEFDSNNISEPRLVIPPKGSVKKYKRKTDNKMAAGKHKMAVISGQQKLTKNCKFKIYKCKNCSSCLSTNKNRVYHKCTGRSRQGKCPICNNCFVNSHLTGHIKMHKLYGKKPVVIYFNPEYRVKGSKKVAYIYKCSCGLHFTSRQSLDKHLLICGDDLNISKEVCSKCHLLFPTDALVTHLCKHHRKSVKVSFEVIEVSKKGYLKCGICSTIYSDFGRFDSHLFHCPIKNGKTCKKCKVNVLQDDTVHNCVPETPITVIKKSVATSRLFKCSSCDIHYFHKSGLQYHIDQNHKCTRKIITCDICKLKLTDQSIDKHMRFHTTEEYYMIKIIDILGRQKIVKGKNIKNDANSSITLKLNENDVSGLNDTENISSDLGNTDKNIKAEKSSSSSKKPIASQNVTSAKKSKTDNGPSVCNIYRCSTCDLCYLFKKSWLYHIERNHVNKRGAIPCEVCSLKFTQYSLPRHEPLHRSRGNYLINVIDPETDETTIIEGKNVKVRPTKKTNKRTFNIEDGSISKKSKTKHDETVISTYSTDDNQLPSTSRFESNDMSEASDIIMPDFDHETGVDDDDSDKNPIVDPSESNLNDITDINYSKTNIMSKRLRYMLNANSRKYNNTLYKCELCGIHFMTLNTAATHFKRTGKHGPSDSFCKCDLCGLYFTQVTFVRHTYIHHNKMKLDIKSINIVPVTRKILNKRNPSLNSTMEENIHIEEKDIEINPNNINIIEIDGDDNVDQDSKTDVLDADNSQGDIDKTDEMNKANSDTDNKQNYTKIQYYKCKDCNVCFIDEDSCRTHCISHKVLDPRLYIECKICNYQFMIDSFKDHVILQHEKEFCLDDLVVTEYTPTKDSVLKIDTYRGIDKVQSRLVSTTTESANPEINIP